MLDLMHLPATLTAAEPRARRVSGRVVPWGVTATVSNGTRVRFERGSIIAPPDPSRSPLLVDHDATEPVGRLAHYVDGPLGLDAEWAIGSSPSATVAVGDAADGVRTGLSIGVEPVNPDHEPDADGVLVFTRDRPARWVETSLLSIPAYDDARVSAVAASAQREGAPVPEPITPAAADTVPASTPEPAAPAVAVTASGPPPAGTPAEVPTVAAGVATITAVRESYPYSFNGVGPSMLADYFDRSHSADAADRLRRAEMMLADPSGLSVMAAPPEGTADQVPLVPSIIRPDLWLAQITRSTPLLNATTRVPVSSANPFLYPVTTGSAGLVVHPGVEKGTPIAPGTISTATVTLQPVLVNGAYQFTRSLLDASSPSIDVVAATEIREQLARNIEATVATALAVAADTTAHTFVVTAGNGQQYLQGLRHALSVWWPNRYAPPTNVIAGSADYGLAVMADDSTARPLMAPVSPMNAPGSANFAAGTLNFYGIGLEPSAAAPVSVTYIIRQEDVSTFMSPISSFRFEEKLGPEVIELAFRLYIVCKVRRPQGVMACAHTLTTTTLAEGDLGGGFPEPDADDEPAKGRKG